MLNGAQLKLIAIFSMLIDHVNKALIYPYLEEGSLLSYLSDLFDILGRIAFPIFCFMMVEGFFKTRSRKKYLGNLLLFGILSEIPFDLFTTVSFYEPNWNNILFTFAMLLAMLWAIDWLRQRMERFPKVLWFLVSALLVALTCLLSMVTGVDYEYHAILIGFFFYLFHQHPVFAIPFCFLSMYKEPWALLGFGCILLYNGQRGRIHKQFHYWFYPVHMLILGLLRLGLGI